MKEKFYINKCIIKMSNKVKDIDIKNYFFLLFIKIFHPNDVKIDEKSYKKYSYLLHWI